MKIFLRKLFVFIVVFVLVAGGIIGAASLYMNSTKFSIPETRNILVIGDSHTECSIDDSTFRRAVNFSKSATPFIYSYASLRKLISDNPHIDTVLLSFHSGSLLRERERTWIFGEAEMALQVPVFLPYFTFSEWKLFLLKPDFYKPALAAPWSALDYYKSRRNNDMQVWMDKNIGNFRDLRWNHLAKDTAAIKPWAERHKTDTLSHLMLKYIREIDAFCKKKNIALILFNAPVYKWRTYANYETFYENRRKYLSDIPFLDYAEFPIADSCRYDIFHLNGKGARQFSQYLDTNLARDIKQAN